MPALDTPLAMNRRRFLIGASATCVALSAAPAQALPFLRRASEPDVSAQRSLFMVHQRTSEVFEEVYFDGETYLQDPLARFAAFARDMRTGEAGAMDPELLDLAHDLQQLIGPQEPLILTHGFRSTARGVRRGAANSRHHHGQALDIAHPRLRPGELHRHAAALGRGGLGRYRSFVHIDTGPTRHW